MRIGCISEIAKPEHYNCQVLVLPEYSEATDAEEIAKLNPEAVIVYAKEDRGFSRAQITYRGRHYLDYLKVNSDGRTMGSEHLPLTPVVSFGYLAIGVIVCMDVQLQELIERVAKGLKQNEAPNKVLCIPADMGGWWFSDNELVPPFEGINVAVSNHATNHGFRCRSFISDIHRKKIVEQMEKEPIFYDLAVSRE